MLNEDVILSHMPQLGTFGGGNGVLSSDIGGICIYSGGSSGSSSSSSSSSDNSSVRNNSLIYVCNTNHRIVALDAISGTFIGTVHGDGSKGSGDAQLSFPSDICLLAPGTIDESPFLFIADPGNHRVQVVNCGTGALVGSIGGNGKGNRNDQLNSPFAVCISLLSSSNSSTDNPLLFIADKGNRRVQVYNAKTLTYVRTFGTGHLSDDLRGICIGGAIAPSDSSSSIDYSIFVCDTGKRQILEFSAASGSFIKSIGSGKKGKGRDELDCNLGICYLSAGAGLKSNDPLLYVADSANKRVAIFNANTGARVRNIDVGHWPAHVVPAVSLDGDFFLYVSCWNSHISEGYLQILNENNFAGVFRFLHLLNHKNYDGFVYNLDYELRDELIETIALEMRCLSRQRARSSGSSAGGC